MPGSVAVILTRVVAPSSIGFGMTETSVMLGATLSTVTVKLSLLAPPSSSVTVKVTA